MLRPGDRFGDYTVVTLLGKGGMGLVFLLRNAAGGQVAAKILDPGAAGDHEARKRFLREAEFACGVKHPNLVETYDVGEDPDTGLCYILMEYVPGGSLADRLKAGPLAINDAIRIVYQIAYVLELARQKGIVHRDIKPGNIMFGADGKAKLADLGIARGGLGGTDTTTVTQTGMMIGTPAYMAPEQMLDAHNVDTRADIYSLGIVFYEMLAGKRPNADDTVVQLMAKAVKGEPIPDVRTMRPEVSASLAQLLSMMVAPDKDGRISTPGQITNALGIIARGGEFEVKKPTARDSGRARTPVASPSAERRASFLWKALVPVGVFGVFAAVFVLLAPKRTIRQTVTTDVVERAVEKRDAVTNVVYVQGGAAADKKAKDGKYICETPEGEWSYHVRDGKAWPVGAGVHARTIRYADEDIGSNADKKTFDPEKLKDPDPTRAVQKALDALFPGWKASEIGDSGSLGYWREREGETDVICTHPPRRGVPAVLSKTLVVEGKSPVLHVRIANNELGSQFRLRVRVAGKVVREKDITSGWTDVYVDLRRWSGKTTKIELEHLPTGWRSEWAFWSVIEVVDDVSFVDVAALQDAEPFVKIHDRRQVVGTNPKMAAQRTCDVLFPGWKISECGHPEAAGYEEEHKGRYNLLFTHPPREDVPVVISRRMTLPRKTPKLYVSVIGGDDFELQVKVNGKIIQSPVVDGREWTDLEVDLSEWAGKNVLLEVLNMPTGWRFEEAHWQRLEVK